MLQRTRELFQEKSYGRGPNGAEEIGFVHDLPLAAVASEQIRHAQFASAAAEAMVGCEELVRQTAAWEGTLHTQSSSRYLLAYLLILEGSLLLPCCNLVLVASLRLRVRVAGVGERPRQTGMAAMVTEKKLAQVIFYCFSIGFRLLFD